MAFLKVTAIATSFLVLASAIDQQASAAHALSADEATGSVAAASMTPEKGAQSTFWSAFQKAYNTTRNPTAIHPIGNNNKSSASYFVGLKNYILAQQKYGTSSLKKSMDERPGGRLPQVGDLRMLIDGDNTGKPYGVIMFTGVEVVKYDAVSALFASKEGEGGCGVRATLPQGVYNKTQLDCFYKHWDAAHVPFNKASYSNFNRSWEVVAMEFKLLWPQPSQYYGANGVPSNFSITAVKRDIGNLLKG